MASPHPVAGRFGARSAARSTSARRLPPIVVVLLLLVIAAIGAAPVIALSSRGPAPVAGATAAEDAAQAASSGISPSARAELLAANAADALRPASVVSRPITSPAEVVKAAVNKQAQDRASARRASTHRAATHSTATRYSSPSYSYSGTNHVWIPSLGINRAVYWFPCSRTTDPGMVVYRWGCAGTNNVYLMAHAGGPFYALNRAYYNGQLRVGLKVVYANSSGTVHTYSVIWWRVVRPTTAASWAWASLSRPSMTLQTCLGANSEYRLMVRLVQIS